jgi:hypothetical protein
MSYQKPGLTWWGESFVSTFFYQTHPFISIAALFSLYMAFKKRDFSILIISWFIILVFVLQIKRSRYILILFPMFTLMASYGLQRIKSIELKRFVVYSIVSSSLVIALFVYSPFLQKMSSANFKDAGRFLNSTDYPYVEVITLPFKGTKVNPAIAVPMLDLFMEKEISYQYDTLSILPFEKIRESSVRFTWGYKNPEYYETIRRNENEKPAVVIISNELAEQLPEYAREKIKRYDKVKVFQKTTGLFRYNPFVTVYQPRF